MRRAPSLTRTDALEPDAEVCPFGGTRLVSGLDLNGNGTLEAEEESSSQVLCAGSGIAVRQTEVAPGDECAAGGVQIESGIDENGNGALDDTEVQNSDVVCGVPNLLFDTESIAEGDAMCPHGGQRIRMGHDDGQPAGVGGDSTLQDGEVEVTRQVCLAASDVLINGGKSDCSLGTSRQGPSTLLWGLVAAGLALTRRRRKRVGL